MVEIKETWMEVREGETITGYTWGDYAVKVTRERRVISASYITGRSDPPQNVPVWRAYHKGELLDFPGRHSIPQLLMEQCEKHSQSLS